MKHIPERWFDIMVISPGSLKKRQQKWFAVHLGRCRRCSDSFEDTKEFYRKLEERFAKEPLEEDKELAEYLSAPGLKSGENAQKLLRELREHRKKKT